MRIFSYSALFLFFLLFGSPGYAATNPEVDVQKGSIQGLITRADKTPVAGVAVTLKGTLRGTVTLDDGRFELLGVPVGDYQLVVHAVHIKVAERAVRVVAGEVSHVQIEVEEAVTHLSEIVVPAARGVRPVEKMPDVEGTSIFAGKKTEVIHLDRVDANLITNNTRQIFAKVPGISIWENDGSGVQVGVASRGLSPDRSWEFNVRQNGYDITAAPFGYPEAYYNPPMEAVERIQIVRGASSLQYGPQFGGLLNYVLKRGDANRKISVETQQSVGSFGMVSTFNAVGGTVGKINYYGYVHHRQADGWRENSAYSITNFHFNINYAVSRKLNIGFEISRMFYENQQPGGLSDAQFAENARQSNRSRDWISIPWTVPTLTVDYQVSDNWKSSVKAFALFGERNLIGFAHPITLPDDLTSNRIIDRATYRNAGAEWRNTIAYSLFGARHTVAAGARYFYGHLHRRQFGRGDTGADFNLNLQEADFPRDLSFPSVNTALFVENLFRITPRWTVTPGIRYETIRNETSGQFSRTAAGDPLQKPQQQAQRNFFLLGVGSEYTLGPAASLYANVSQAYRPILFADIVPPVTTDVIDPNLRDASGYSADLGVRGSYKNFITYDISGFFMHYDNRIGTLTRFQPDGVTAYRFRTNVGASRASGIESYVEVAPIAALTPNSKAGYINFFASLSWINAVYTDFLLISNVGGTLEESNLRGNRVENAPGYIHRLGATYTMKSLSVTWQVSSVGEAFADAANTRVAPATAVTGLIPSYRVMDLSATWRFLRRYNLRAGINNLSDERYFTRRAGGYPGPGLMPAEGRNWYLSVGAKF